MESTGSTDLEQWGKLYIREDHIVSREIAGETILVPIRGNLADMRRIFSLNAVAAYVWEELDGKTSLGSIRSGILENFDVEEEEADADLIEFISEFLDAGLIVGLP